MANNEEFTPKRKRAEAISYDMEDLLGSTVLPSRILEKREKEKPVEVDEYYANDEWMAQLSEVSKIKASRRLDGDIFDDYDGGKKKKKKKKKTELTDYNETFSTELTLLQNTLKQQMRFTDNIQRKYDQMDAQKSSARGVGKFTTDLISAITSSRSLSKEILKDVINTKKTIAELTMKEKEKLKKAGDEDGDDIIGFSSKFLKNLTTTDRQLLEKELGNIDEIEDDDDLFDSINDVISGDPNASRSEDSDKFLRYEHLDITVKAKYDPDTTYTEFYAEDKDGNVVPDYPVPKRGTRLTLNPSTMIGIDSYGQKYPVEFF